MKFQDLANLISEESVSFVYKIVREYDNYIFYTLELDFWNKIKSRISNISKSYKYRDAIIENDYIEFEISTDIEIYYSTNPFKLFDRLFEDFSSYTFQERLVHDFEECLMLSGSFPFIAQYKEWKKLKTKQSIGNQDFIDIENSDIL